MGTSILLNRPMRSGVTTLGFGRRVAIWVQGCSLGCRGCVSQDTWRSDSGLDCETEALAEVIVAAAAGHDGLTISGGEPFEQPEALEELLRHVRTQVPEDFDILSFSGFRRETLEERHPALIQMLDVLVDGRFQQDRPTLLPLRGSANQRLHRLSPLAEVRYADGDIEGARPPLQLVALDPAPEWAGIPSPGELEALEERLRASGIELQGVSWRS